MIESSAEGSKPKKTKVVSQSRTIHELCIRVQMEKTGETAKQVINKWNKVAVQGNDPRQVKLHERVLEEMQKKK
jgi:hypothetical protein